MERIIDYALRVILLMGSAVLFYTVMLPFFSEEFHSSPRLEDVSSEGFDSENLEPFQPDYSGDFRIIRREEGRNRSPHRVLEDPLEYVPDPDLIRISEEGLQAPEEIEGGSSLRQGGEGEFSQEEVEEERFLELESQYASGIEGFAGEGSDEEGIQFVIKPSAHRESLLEEEREGDREGEEVFFPDPSDFKVEEERGGESRLLEPVQVQVPSRRIDLSALGWTQYRGSGGAFTIWMPSQMHHVHVSGEYESDIYHCEAGEVFYGLERRILKTSFKDVSDGLARAELEKALEYWMQEYTGGVSGLVDIEDHFSRGNGHPQIDIVVGADHGQIQLRIILGDQSMYWLWTVYRHQSKILASHQVYVDSLEILRP